MVNGISKVTSVALAIFFYIVLVCTVPAGSIDRLFNCSEYLLSELKSQEKLALNYVTYQSSDHPLLFTESFPITSTLDVLR